MLLQHRVPTLFQYQQPSKHVVLHSGGNQVSFDVILASEVSKFDEGNSY
jgi:hypothetical protein